MGSWLSPESRCDPFPLFLLLRAGPETAPLAGDLANPLLPETLVPSTSRAGLDKHNDEAHRAGPRDYEIGLILALPAVFLTHPQADLESALLGDDHLRRALHVKRRGWQEGKKEVVLVHDLHLNHAAGVVVMSRTRGGVGRGWRGQPSGIHCDVGWIESHP